MTKFRSNCIIEALKAGGADGWRGYLGIRVSRCGRSIHVIYTNFDGAVVNFVPPGNTARKPFPPPLFHGVSINHDEAWRCHIQMREWGVPEKELRNMSDDDVIGMFNRVLVEREKMQGDY